ncbi:MAG: hypothetical protein L0I29_13945 [Hyphomicrobiales bacterium]|nr:hypothetical protein [Hyphomicrobiales bacterium]
MSAGLALASVEPAFAHAGDAGFVLLLPTGYYLVGGALAVALSFAILAVVPPGPLARLAEWRRVLFAAPWEWRLVLSWLSFAGFAALLLAGWWGSRDPLSNPLPLVFWTILWGALTIVEGLVGDFWFWINPWYGPYRLLAALRGRSGAEDGERALPGGLAYWPAAVLFLGFAWFELVYPAPEDPARLATVLLVYYLANLAAALVFGYSAWVRQGECLSAFFRMISRLALFSGRRDEKAHKRTIDLALPGARLISADALPASGILFLLLALSSVSFDGLSRTFTWLGFVGINPLDFPGRSAVVGVNTAGLVGMAVALCGAFLLAVWLGHLLCGSAVSFRRTAGALAWSIIPISLAYHIAHNLTEILVNAQYALAAISDPFALGWDLFGTAGMHVHAGITAGYDSAWAIWNSQAAVIIAGHVLAVLVAHAIAWRLHGSARKAVLSQIPLALLMVFYTVFGLWLLASPTGA